MSVNIFQNVFGEMVNDKEIKCDIRCFTMKNDCLEVKLITYGATIVSIKLPNKFGVVEDIVLGFDDISSYVDHKHYFGCTVGRVANRLANGEFNLNGEKYTLAKNNYPNHLHGGNKGFDKVIWEAEVEGDKVVFNYTSSHMEENYPGEMTCSVSFELQNNELILDYRAKSTLPTPVNLTNHSYYNLAGHDSGSIHDQVITINADCYVPVNASLIPTGKIEQVSSTPFDLRKPSRIGHLLKLLPEGMDHNFCVNGTSAEEKFVGSVHDPKSGRLMEVFSTQPGVQFYTANFLPEDDSLAGKSGKFYRKHGALCLETQNYPDAINQVNFPKAYIDVDEIYRQRTRLKFLIQ